MGRRALACTAAMSLLALLGASTAMAAPPVTVNIRVHPTGEFPVDLEAVQAAVDLGGTIVLEAVNEAGVPTAFNFGPPAADGAVFLTKDVVILGTPGPHATTIMGGWLPFFGIAPTHTHIEGITFRGAELSAAVFIASTGVEFVDNRVTGLVGSDLGFATEGRGIKFLGNWDPSANTVTGHILIEDNRFDNLHADLSDAIVFDGIAADVTVAGNEVEDVGTGGILYLSSSGDLHIDRNTIAPGPGNGSEFHAGNGMLIAGATGAVQVTRNTVHCDSPIADPILIVASSELGFEPVQSPVVRNNDIRTETTEFGGITLFGDVSDAYVANNRVRGTALYGLGVLPFFSDAEVAANNRFIGNNLTGLDANLADTLVFSHATNTVVVGNAGDVIDFGEGSVITGERPIRGDLAGIPGRTGLLENLVVAARGRIG